MNEIFSMTNTTELIELNGKKYILRTPGAGTSKLIDRHQEHAVYKEIMPYMISDEVLYFNENSGIKIARYIENCHNCNSRNVEDVTLAMVREVAPYIGKVMGDGDAAFKKAWLETVQIEALT